MMEPLTLPEDLLLLALNDQTGELHGNYLDYALAGSALAELALQNILGEHEGHFILNNDQVSGNLFLDSALSVVKEKGIEKKPTTLINAIASKKWIKKQLFDQLVEQGILQTKTKRVFFFFEKTVYPEALPTPERALKKRLETAMFGAGEVEARDSVLIALAQQTGLLRYNFDRQKLKENKARINDIAKGGMLATSATAQTIQSVQAAIMVAIIVPAIVT